MRLVLARRIRRFAHPPAIPQNGVKPADARVGEVAPRALDQVPDRAAAYRPLASVTARRETTEEGGRSGTGRAATPRAPHFRAREVYRLRLAAARLQHGWRGEVLPRVVPIGA